jgi:EmrB/QacA subfamily drug resistance transporter
MWPSIRKRFAGDSSPDFVLAVVCIGIFFAALDQTVIYGALPDMMNDIGLPVTRLDQAAWIVIGYLLGYTLAMPLMGRVSDVYGHGRIYILSLLIFMVGSIGVALAINLQWIVGARILQAIGGGALVPVAMAIAGDFSVEKRRAVALGIIGAAVEAGGALGPFYGAAMAQYLGWRWIFWINIPVSLLAIFIVFPFFGRSPRTQGRIDYIGGFFLAIALGFFSLGVSRQSGQPDFLVYLIGFLIGSVLFFVFFILRIKRVSEPLFELSMFRNITFFAANLTNLLVGGALVIAMVNIPLMSDTIMGKSPLEGGLRLLRLTIMLSIGAVTGGFLCKRFGYRAPTILGLILSSIGFFFMSRWSISITDPWLTLHVAVCGYGLGLVIAPLASAVMDSVRQDKGGIASSLIVMTRMIGMIIGLSVITSWGMGRFHLMTVGMSLTEIVAAPENLVDSLLALFHDFFIASMGICLAAILPSIWLRGEKRPSGTSFIFRLRK